MQPELFAPDECRRVAALPHDQREWTRAPVDTSGPAAYAILVRAPGDPERRSREARHAAMGVVGAAGEWKALRKDSVDVWAGRFTELLVDRVARAARLGLPTGGDVIRAWVAPLSWWGVRLPAAIATAHPTNTWSRFRARRRTH